MKRALILLLTTFLFTSSPVLAEFSECPPGETRYRPGGICQSTSPQEPHTKIEDYPLTCIPASSIKYSQTTTNPDSIPSSVVVNLSVDLSQAQLGGFGPDQDTVDISSSDQLAQQYLFNALFDKPVVTDPDTSSPRESFRTYWRLLNSYQQATAKAIYLDYAKPSAINQFLRILPTLDPQVNFFPIISYIINDPQLSLSSTMDLLRTASQVFSLNIDFSEARKALQNDEVHLRRNMNNHTIIYQYKNKEEEISARELASKLPLCLRTTPVCKNYQTKYSHLNSKTKAAYDALLPFNFDNTQGYLVFKNKAIEENLPFLKAINQGINERHTGLIYTLSPGWMQTDIQSQLIKIESGLLLPNTVVGHASKYLCSSTPQELLSYVSSPLTYPSQTELTQPIVFTDLQQTGKKQIDTESSCQGEGQYGYYCSTYTSQESCQESTYNCTWISKPIYEYTYSAEGKGSPLIVLNSPLVTNITNSIVSGATSLYKMLLPHGASEPEKRFIDAPTSDFSASSSQPNSSVSVTTSDGSNTIPIYRESNLAQDSLCLLQNEWLIPEGIQKYSPCSSLVPSPSISGDINCDQNAPAISYPGILKQKDAATLATNWLSGRGHHHVNECYNDVINRSLEAGIHPGFTLLIWLNESNASNYQAFTTPLLDFGINLSDIKNDFDSQITRFLSLPQKYRDHYPFCFDHAHQQGYTDMQTFLHLFHSGHSGDSSDLQACLPNKNSTAYYNGLSNRWYWVAPNLPFPQYPTDMP